MSFLFRGLLPFLFLIPSSARIATPLSTFFVLGYLIILLRANPYKDSQADTMDVLMTVEILLLCQSSGLDTSSTSEFFLLFSSFSLFEFLYLVIEVSDSNDRKRTMVLQVILIVNMFASLVPRTRLITYSHLECP